MFLALFLKAFFLLVGAVLLLDDVLKHTVGSPLSGRARFKATRPHHGYYGLIMLLIGTAIP